MTASHSSEIARGVAPLLLFAALSAGVDVYAGNQLQVLSPLSVAAISFSLTAAFFLGGDLAQRGMRAVLLPLRTNRSDVIALNVSTALTWLSMLYALRYLEPAIVNVVAFAIGPAFTLLLSLLLRRRTAALPTEIAVAVGICGCVALLVFGTVTGRSGMGHVGTRTAALGTVLTLVCGLSSTATVIYSKRLSEAGQSPQSVLAIRFFIIIAVAWAMVAISDNAALAAAFLPATVIAVIGVGLPLYLVQLGIKHTEPITVSLIMALSPPFAVLLQLVDRRLQPSMLTLIGVVGITALVALGVIVRSRKNRAIAGAIGGTGSHHPGSRKR